MAAYNALFTGTNNTDLSAYTSDSGHTHTKQSGSGSIQILTNALSALTSNQSAFYTASYTPPSADYELEFDIDVNTANAFVLGMGLRCETDGDGVFAQFDGFTDVFALIKVVGGSETGLDTFTIPDLTLVTYNLRIAATGGNVEWFVDDVSQGTHSLGGDLSAAGLIGFTKFGQASNPASEDVRILNALVTESGAPALTPPYISVTVA